jgi:hypothetical protein
VSSPYYILHQNHVQAVSIIYVLTRLPKHIQLNINGPSILQQTNIKTSRLGRFS